MYIFYTALYEVVFCVAQNVLIFTVWNIAILHNLKTFLQEKNCIKQIYQDNIPRYKKFGHLNQSQVFSISCN